MYDEIWGRYLLWGDTGIRFTCGVIALMVLVADATALRVLWPTGRRSREEPWLSQVMPAGGAGLRQATGNCAAGAWRALGVNLDRLRAANEDYPARPVRRGG